MADIKDIAIVKNGTPTNTDISGDALVMLELLLGGVAGTRLTKATLDNLIANSHASGSDNQSITAGNGLTGGGSGATISLDIGAGDGIIVNADDIAVDGTVLRSAQLGTANGIATLDASGILTESERPQGSFINKVAGEAFAANETIAVRYAISGETAGRIYKLDPTDDAKSDPIGLVRPTSAVTAGDSITVILAGELTSHIDFTASQDEGKPIFVTTNGVPTVTDPGSGFNLIQLGMVSNVGVGTSIIGIQAPRLIAIRP